MEYYFDNPSKGFWLTILKEGVKIENSKMKNIHEIQMMRGIKNEFI